jgi:hypothetical protein
MEANPLFGRPWNIVGRFNTFEEADKKRKQLQSKENLQVKVKKLKENYVVKARSTITEPKKENKRTKSRRKDKNFYKNKRKQNEQQEF